jgi:hypothetical protein
MAEVHVLRFIDIGVRRSLCNGVVMVACEDLDELLREDRALSQHVEED